MNHKKLALLIIAGMITISPVYTVAHEIDDADEMKGHITESLQGVPEDVKLGSIQVDEDASEEQLSKLASISIRRAITIAHQTVQGKIIKAALNETEGFLVWEVEVAREAIPVTVLKIDAGDGKLLAAEQDEEGAWWQFWN